jgi:DNA-binding beta-propeller fold protein YncE
VAFDAAANELFVADTGNRRIVVFDADKGTYKRHWFAYGERTAGPAPGPYAPNDPPAKSFRDLTCVEISRDGQVYVCDRTSNRIQVFRKDGTFVREGVVSKNTLGATVSGQFGVVSSHGSAWDLAFSSDQQQRYVFVANGHDKKVHVLQRETLMPIGSFGTGGRYPGQFLAVGSIAVDARGDVYTGEQHHGKRVQKFVQR